MSKLQVNDIVNKDDNGSVGFSKGAIVTGVVTATTFDGDATGLSGTPNVVVGVASASQFKGPDGNTAFFYGDGSGLINVNPSSTAGINIKNDNNVIGVAGTITVSYTHLTLPTKRIV